MLHFLLCVVCSSALVASACLLGAPAAQALAARAQPQQQAHALPLGGAPSSRGSSTAAALSSSAVAVPGGASTSSSPGGADAVEDLASEMEDGLLQAFRQIEAGMDSALEAVTSGVPAAGQVRAVVRCMHGV